jgi:hypothetical protein
LALVFGLWGERKSNKLRSSESRKPKAESRHDTS